MKKSLFVFFLIPFISCCQIDSEFLLQKSIKVEWGKNICISKNDCFHIKNDSELYFEFLYYSHNRCENMRKIDSSGISAYGSVLNNFKSKKDSSYIMIWKIELENTPLFKFYYINNGIVKKIGEDWLIYTPPTGEYHYDYFDYSVNDIHIYQKKNDEIEFVFSENVDFLDHSKILFNSDDWVSFRSGELILYFNITDGTVKRVEKRE